MAYDVFDRKWDVAVAGGGLIGWAAAVTAARAGKRVVLVCRRSSLGWEISAALDVWLIADRSPLADEDRRRAAKIGAAAGDQIASAAAEFILDEIAAEAGVEILLYAAALSPAVADIRWQYDLAAAEALALMGRHDDELARPYLTDDRAYVRRYAQRVMTER